MRSALILGACSVLALAGPGTVSAHERLPSGVRQVDITAGYRGQRPITSVHVTGTAKVRTIVRWLDELRQAPTGTYHCPALTAGLARVTFTFRAEHGAVLARARMIELTHVAGPCNPIVLTLHGHAQKPLAGSFVGRVQRLIGARLLLPRRG